MIKKRKIISFLGGRIGMYQYLICGRQSMNLLKLVINEIIKILLNFTSKIINKIQT